MRPLRLALGLKGPEPKGMARGPLPGKADESGAGFFFASPAPLAPAPYLGAGKGCKNSP